MRRIVINNIKILKLIIYILWGIISLPLVFIFKGFFEEILFFAIFVLGIYIISFILNNIINRKINKIFNYSLSFCDFIPLIKELENEISIINIKKNSDRYYHLKLTLLMVNIYQYGLSEKNIKEFKKIDTSNLNKKDLILYNQQLILIYAKENNFEEAYSLFNSLVSMYPHKDFNLVRELLVLRSNEEKEQEAFFSTQVSKDKKSYKYNYISSVFNLGRYYYKIGKYDKSCTCLEYVRRNANNTYFSKESIMLMKEMNINPSLENVIDCDINVIKYGNPGLVYGCVKILIYFVFIILFLFNVYIVGKIGYADKNEFVKYMDNICPVKVQELNINNDIKVNVNLVTDDDCKYTVRYMECDDERIYDYVVDNVTSNYNLGIVEKYSSFSEKSVIFEGNYNGDKYYSKIFFADGIMLYAIGNNSYKNEINDIFDSLRYSEKYELKTILK